jgi:hypothetical protein
MSRFASPIIALLVLSACSAPSSIGSASLPASATPPAPTPSREPDPLAEPTVDGLFVVDSDNRRIAVRCWGDGQVVVLDGSFEGSAFTRELARHARVCLHDDAGVGFDDNVDGVLAEVLTLLEGSS